MHSQLCLPITEETTSHPPSAAHLHSTLNGKQRELGSLFGASMHVCAEIDVSELPPDVAQAVTDVKACIAKNLPVLSKHGVGYYEGMRKKKVSTHHGPVIVDPSGVEVPLSPASEHPPPSSSSTPAAPADKGKKKGRQGFTCA